METEQPKRQSRTVKASPKYTRLLVHKVGQSRAANLIGVVPSVLSEGIHSDAIRLAYEQAAELHYLRLGGELPSAEAHRLLVVRAKPGAELDAVKAVLKGLGIKYMEFTDA